MGRAPTKALVGLPKWQRDRREVVGPLCGSRVLHYDDLYHTLVTPSRARMRVLMPKRSYVLVGGLQLGDWCDPPRESYQVGLKEWVAETLVLSY